MTDLMEEFYNCVSKTIVEEILNADGEYRIRTGRQDAEIERLNSTWDKITASCVDELLTEQLAIGEIRECACFRAGFQIALALTR